MALKPDNHADDPWAKKHLLCLDGGGVRGLSSLLILKELMNKIARLEELENRNIGKPKCIDLHGQKNGDSKVEAHKDITSDSTSYLPCHYFDYIGGTSTGDLIAIMLGRLRMDVDTAIQTYEDLASSVLGAQPSTWKRLVNVRSLSARQKKDRGENLLRTFNKIRPRQPSIDEVETAFESDSSRCRTVVFALRSENVKDYVRIPYLFRSYHQGPERSSDSVQTFKIEEVARATVAASRFFEPLQLGNVQFYDASTSLCNSSLAILEEVNQVNGKSQEGVELILSVGSSYVMEKYRRAGADKEPAVSPDIKYFRFRFNSESELQIHLNERKPKEATTIDKLERAMKWLEFDIDRVDQDLQGCAALLVKQRRKRAKTQQWENFALGIRYRCALEGVDCKYKAGGPMKPFQTQNELLDHLRIEHGMAPPNLDNCEEIKRLLDKGRTNSW
ncbi:MAG: hypothetical protein MMC33_002231 [Icmadophila ericetorum]|nr:hypothetical protein [Icmadophila ericetorum]